MNRASDQVIVHVIDDDESLRRALDRALRTVGLETRLYGTPQEFVKARRPDSAGCIILDVRLPGTSGLELQRKLRDIGILLPVILMTGYGDIPMSVRAMKDGAVDFLPKPFREQEMLDAVELAIDRDRQRRLLERDAAATREKFRSLSPREQEVMLRVAEGKMNKQIAYELSITEVTVKVHRGSVMRKMEAGSLAELVRMSDLIRARLS